MMKYIVLMALVSVVSAMDNCTREDDYLCGDQCMAFNGICSCGETHLKKANVSSVQCCGTNCTVTEISAGGTYNARVSCSSGQVSPLTRGCPSDNGTQCNFYKTDVNRNFDEPAYATFYRSYWPCANGRECVPEHLLCHGQALCQDQSDLAVCETEEWVSRTCSPTNWGKCSHDSGECIPDSFIGDGKFDCLRRQDELADTNIENDNSTNLNLTTCYTSVGPGLFCRTDNFCTRCKPSVS